MNWSRRGKLPIIIPEGHIRPLVPDIASKYATECNITVRNHVPVLKNWKEYKKHPALIDLFLGILCVSTFSKFFPLFISLQVFTVLNHAPYCLLNKNLQYFKHKEILYSKFSAMSNSTAVIPSLCFFQ